MPNVNGKGRKGQVNAEVERWQSETTMKAGGMNSEGLIELKGPMDAASS